MHEKPNDLRWVDCANFPHHSEADSITNREVKSNSGSIGASPVQLKITRSFTPPQLARVGCKSKSQENGDSSRNSARAVDKKRSRQHVDCVGRARAGLGKDTRGLAGRTENKFK